MAQPGQPKQSALGWMGRLQMYVLIMGCYYGYQYWSTGKNPLAPKPSTAKAGAASSQCKDASLQAKRRFKAVGGAWISFFEAGLCSDVQLLMLHRTSLSAETEFSNVIPQILTTAASAGGLQVLAPDRPCHGYSPCPKGGERHMEQGYASGLFGHLLAGRASSQKFSFVASGREASRSAIELVQLRGQPAQILLLRPQLMGPDATGVSSAVAATDSARWIALNSGYSSKKDKAAAPLNAAATMPRGCTVILMYLEGDAEDDDLYKELEDGGITVEVRHVDSLEDGVVPAVTDMLAVDGVQKADTIEDEI